MKLQITEINENLVRFDIARQETLETCINKLNKFMQNPEKNFSIYNLEIV